jgi:competence protein ComEC
LNPLRAPLAALVAGILVSPHLDEGSVWVALPVAALVGWIRPKLIVIAVFLTGSAVRSIADLPPPRLVDDGYAARVVARIVRGPDQRQGDFTMTLALETANGVAISGRAEVDYFPPGGELRTMFEELDLGTGDRIEILVRLGPPVAFRNPGGFDYRRFLERRGVFWTGALRNPRLLRVLDRGGHFPSALRESMAGRISGRLGGGPVVGSLALGMILGQRQGLEPDAARRFERAGLTHLLVVSGFNLAVVAMAALWAGRWLPFRRRRRTLRLLFALVIVLAYAALVEGDAPVIRATIMACLLIVGTLIDRGYRILTALTASVFIILLFDPLSIEESGFLMTSIAVLAIDRLAVPAIRWIRDEAGRPASMFVRTGDATVDAHLPVRASDWRVVQRLRRERSRLPLPVYTSGGWLSWTAFDVLLVTTAVQAALLPLTVESYHRISLVALPLNVAGAVTASIVTPLGLLVAVLPVPLAAGPALVVDWALRGLVAAVDFALSWPGAVSSVASPPAAIWAGFALVLGWLARAVGRRQRAHAIAATTLAALLTLTAAVVDFSPPPPRYATITFLDVGQGDSILVELPEGRRILIDGGGLAARPDPDDPEGLSPGPRAFSIGEDVVLPYLFGRRIRRLDAVVLSHAHQDHMDGLVDVLDGIDVGELWLGRNPSVRGYVRLLETASRAGVPVRWIARGDVVPPFRVLHPPPDHVVGTSADNDDSLVLLLETPHGPALFAGDLETDLPDPPEDVVVLKVPHHGSRNAAGNLRGRLPVISVGLRNPFGHPHPSRLPALRTDIHGAIRVVLSPEGPWTEFPGL